MMAIPASSSVRATSTALAAFVLSAALVPAPVRAQERDSSPIADNPIAARPAAPTTAPRESNQGVFVRDSAGAIEKLALADRMERLRQWDTAADVLQEIIAKYPDRVVPTKTDERNRIIKYTSVTYAVQERLAKWPADGLVAYKARFEPAAQALLDQAGRDDIASLHKAFSLYFATDAGKAAGLRLIDAYLESGDASAAAWLADRLLTLHPNLQPDERASVLFRAAFAHHLAGDRDLALQRAKDLQTQFANATGTVRGKDVPLAAALQDVLQQPRPEVRAASADSWPTFGGGPSRSTISTGSGKPGTKAFVSVDVGRQNPAGYGAETRAALERQEKLDRESGMSIGIIPSVDNGELFFQDGARVYALSLESGLPLPGWLQTYPDVQKGRYGTNFPPMPTGVQLTLSVTDEHVLAVMGRPDRLLATAGGFPGNFGAAIPAPDTKLVCLDRKTGKERWAATPKQLPEEGTLRSLALTGSPVVVGDNVYVLGRGGKGVQFEDCYVLCFDLNSGKYRWSCYVASANTGNVGFGGEVVGPSDSFSHLAYAGGRLYVLSNVGAVAAVDAYAGSVVWLSLYPRDRQEPQATPFGRAFGGSGITPLPKPWTYNAPIVADGKVWVLPTDAVHLLAYDAATGDEVKRMNLQDFSNPDTLLAVIGDKVLFGDEYKLWLVDWTKYDHETFGRKDLSVIQWRAEFRTSPIRGRAFVTTDTVYVPTKERLALYSIATGKRMVDYPPATSPGWQEEQGAGNVIVTADKVVIAGAKRVDVYTELGFATSRLEAEAKAHPDSADVRLRYADMLFVAGNSTAATQKLDEAIQLLGGPNAMKPGADRARVFNTALTYAGKLAAATTGADGIAAVNALFDRAAAAAADPAQQAIYRAARAKFASAADDHATELRLYQEILSDDALRNADVPREDGTNTPAGLLAEKAIAAVLNTPDGKQLYQPYEQQARQAYDFARAKRDPVELLAIAQRFPNASVAPAATFDAATAYEQANNPRQAVRLLQQMGYKYPDAAEPARVLEAMARNYLLMPNRLDVAISRLNRAASAPNAGKLAGALKLPDGQVIENVTFEQAAQRVRDFRDQHADDALPSFGLPPKARTAPFAGGSGGETLDPVDALVLPIRSADRTDRIVTWTRGAGLSIYPAGQTKPLATAADFPDAPRSCAWVGPNLLVWTDTRALLLRGDTARTVWQVDLAALPAVDVGADAVADADAGGLQVDDAAAADLQAFDPRRGFVAGAGNRPIIVAGGGVVRFGRGGQIIVQQPANPNPAGGAPGPEQIAVARPAGDRAVFATSNGRLFAVDLAEGRLAWQYRLSATAPVERLEATDDFAVAKLTDGTTVYLAAFDVYTGQPLLRTPFNTDAGVPGPVNLALAPDGTFIFTLPDRICGKDLYDPSKRLTFSYPTPPGLPIYQGMTDPDQLAVVDDRILAVSDSGQMIRVHSLDTGRVVTRTRTRDGRRETDNLLSTGAKAGALVTLRIARPFFYALGESSLNAYDLRGIAAGTAPARRTVPPNAGFRDAFIGAEYAVVLDHPGAQRIDPAIPAAPNAAAPPTTCRLLAYSRAKTASGESGALNHDPTITDPAGITAWQPVDGGFYYLSADRKLHFLRGAAPHPK
jgi:outer membrane protein assembly factor BamB